MTRVSLTLAALAALASMTFATAPCAAPINGIFGDEFEAYAELPLIGPITTNTTLQGRATHLIAEGTQVIVKAGVTLTIAPGARIESGAGGSLVVARGARIEAAGTGERPIVFTSRPTSGVRAPGDWGGLILLGRAPINTNALSSVPSNEASFPGVAFVPDSMFGGNLPADDSGTLRYVRIEFGGSIYVADRRFDGLTLAGVGSGTEIDFVQVHRNASDGIEVIGGTTGFKHFVSSQNADDGVAITDGWTGRVQFLVVQHLAPEASIETANGLESQNHSTAQSYTAVPRTQPLVYNATFIGKPDYAVGSGSFAAVLRRGTRGDYRNVIFTQFPRGLEARDPATANELMAGTLTLTNSILWNNDALGDGDNFPPPQTSNDIDEAAFFVNITNRQVDPGLDPRVMSLAAPRFGLVPTAAALTGGGTPPGNDGFFDPTATFVGAVGPEDWTIGWTRFDQPPP